MQRLVMHGQVEVGKEREVWVREVGKGTFPEQSRAILAYESLVVLCHVRRHDPKGISSLIFSKKFIFL